MLKIILNQPKFASSWICEVWLRLHGFYHAMIQFSFSGVLVLLLLCQHGILSVAIVSVSLIVK